MLFPNKNNLILISFVYSLPSVFMEVLSKEELPLGSDLEEVRVVQGQNATLPCRVSTPVNDSPVLTLWYISEKDTPVYSFDERPGQKTSHWYDPKVFESRAFYQSQWTPPSLEIARTQTADGRLYRCRVDFSHSNSKIAWVKLDIIVPPERLEIQARISPVQLGQKKDVVCIAFGGSPSPQVLWLQEGEVVDSTYNSTSNEEVSNVLDVPASRSDLKSSFLCQAINNDLKRPKDLSYSRNVTSEPLKVFVSTEDEPLTEGRPALLTCTVIGSNPPPLVTWYQKGHEIKPLLTKISERDNVTTSTLTINVTRSDHNRHLICRAVNKLLSADPLEDIYTMNVNYKPSVNLSLGRSLDPSNLKEGNDVFFECSVDANPPPYKVEWYHENKMLTHNVSTGVLVSKSSLALQKVTLNSSGEYICKVSNVEGDTRSKSITIRIKYAPRCSVTPSLRGVALREPVNVTCVVNADPEKVKFHWTFNNSARKEQSEVVPKDRFVSNGLRSTLFYTPTTERDYGTLLCYAENSVGQQKEPCSFTVISAGPPEAVSGCTFENVTSHSSSVICSSGFNGGLPQRFLLQVWTSDGEQVVNFSSTTPEFLVRSLAAGQVYTIAVTSFNSRGASKPTKLILETLKQAEMHKSLPSRTAPSPLTLVSGVIGGALFVVLCLLFAMWAVRGRRRQDQHQHDFVSDLIKKQSSSKAEEKSLDVDPDILQSGKESRRSAGGGGGLGLTSKEKNYAISEAELIGVQPTTRLPQEEDQRISPDISEISNLGSSTFCSGRDVPQGIGRGVSLGPSGLDIGLGKGFGGVSNLNIGVGLMGLKDFGGEPPVERRKGCTRRALLESPVEGIGGSPSLRQPPIKGGESVL